MARSKFIDTNPKFLAVDLARQLLPGTFEHAVNHLLDHAIDLSHFDARFQNDATGAPAYPPAMLLKIVLVAYAPGIVSSRGIEAACRAHVTFIALSGDQAPHFTTIAHFVSTLGADIAHVFAAVVAICDTQGLIGREMFAIDGVKLPSHASKHRSGTRADFERQAAKLEGAVTTMLERHRAADALPSEPPLAAQEQERMARLERDARFVTQARPLDAADPLHDKSKAPTSDEVPGVFRANAFAYDADARTCVCPAGKTLNRTGGEKVIRDNSWTAFRGKMSDGGPCPLRTQCIAAPETTRVRSVMFFRGKPAPLPERPTARRQRRIDTPEGRAQYGRRFATVEPVFGTLCANKGASPAARSAGARRSTRRGNSSASCTTSRSSRAAGTRRKAAGPPARLPERMHESLITAPPRPLRDAARSALTTKSAYSYNLVMRRGEILDFSRG